jgi:hypothetical protein
MDEDLERLSREELIDEIKQLRQGIPQASGQYGT